MDANEKRRFKIDKSQTKCPKEIEILKTVLLWPPQTKLVHRVYLKVVGHEEDAYIDCAPGFVEALTVKKFKTSIKGTLEGCGVGKMLMKLCLIEETIHNVENNEETKVMKDIKKSVLDLRKENEEKLTKLDKWASSECSKLVYLIMSAIPKDSAHVYFNSALESGYSLMGIVNIDNGETYPKTGHSSVGELKKQYKDGYMNNEKVDVW